MDFDDGTLLKKTLIAVATMGGGCALFLALAGGVSWMASRASLGGAEPTTTAPATSPGTSSQAPSSSSPHSPAQPRGGAQVRGASKTEI